MIKVIYSKKSGKCDIGRELMIKVIYSKKSGKCDIGRLLMIKVIYSKRSGKCDLDINDKDKEEKMRYWTY